MGGSDPGAMHGRDGRALTGLLQRLFLNRVPVHVRMKRLSTVVWRFRPNLTVACLVLKQMSLCVHDCTVLVDRGRGKTARFGMFYASLQKSATLRCDERGIRSLPALARSRALTLARSRGL